MDVIKLSLIHIYSDFNMVDGEIMGKQSSAKDMAQLQSSIDSMTAVSYTHLDVYKRQVIDECPIASEMMPG